MANEALLSAIEAAARCLNELTLGYALVGGAAMPAWGRIRATADADFLVLLDPGISNPEVRLREISDALRRAGFAHLDKADAKQIGDKTILGFWYPVRPHGYSVRVDIMIVQGPGGGRSMAASCHKPGAHLQAER